MERYKIFDTIWELVDKIDNKLILKNIDNNNKIKLTSPLSDSNLYKISPYDYLRNFSKDGIKLWTNTFGEVNFINVKPGPNIIYCKVNDELDIFFTEDGLSTYYSPKTDSWLYDDETSCQIFPSKTNLIWEVGVGIFNHI